MSPSSRPKKPKCISSRSIELANRTVNQKLETVNSHDPDAQLGQIRSRLTSPKRTPTLGSLRNGPIRQLVGHILSLLY
ncbi:hypothetical protein MFLAVUS_007042 [Mucor flavus]|uniref:Uncharacterized protein n=1 Tax=Mucor flavus TaxID=439312 RepID=A0ABP9Z372_9FUNG